MSVAYQVFKLLIEVEDYGLSVKQCMEMRCISRWARDQVVRKQLSLRRHIVKNLIGKVEVDVDGDAIDAIEAFRQGKPPLFICAPDANVVCQTSKELFGLLSEDPALFFLFWDHLNCGVESNACKGCLIKGREIVEPALTNTLGNYPLMCMSCWKEQKNICVWSKHYYHFTLHPKSCEYDQFDYDFYMHLLNSSDEDFIYVNDNLQFIGDEISVVNYDKETYIFFEEFLKTNGYYDDDKDRKRKRKRKKPRIKN